jgi:hypothetical protein
MTDKKIILEELGRMREIMGLNEISKSRMNAIKRLISEGDGTKGIIDEIIPGGAKTMDNLGKLAKTVDDLFVYSTRLSELAPSKSFDDFLAVVSKQNNNQDVTADMVRRFIASDAKLSDELMGAASKISEEAVGKLMQDVKFTDVFVKAGMSDLPETMKGILGTKIDSGSMGQVKAGLDSMEDIIKSTNLKDTVEGKELLDQISGKRKQIGDYEDFQTKKSSPTPSVTSEVQDPQSYLNKYTNEELIKMHDSYSWKDVNRSTNLQMSGWKFHIFGEDVKDAVFLTDKLTRIAQKYNATAKVGGEYHFSSESYKPGQYQYGKAGVTMYIPTDVIKAGRQQEMLTDIQNAISGYKKGGTIQGDQAITPQIHYRYELQGPINYEEGVSLTSNIPVKNSDGTPTMKDGEQVYTSEYSQMYSKNEGGAYKPDDVNDLFSKSTNKSTNNTTNTVSDVYTTNRQLYDAYLKEGGDEKPMYDWFNTLPEDQMNDIYKYIEEKKINSVQGNQSNKVNLGNAQQPNQPNQPRSPYERYGAGSN